jgi:hypothetical protein
MDINGYGWGWGWGWWWWGWWWWWWWSSSLFILAIDRHLWFSEWVGKKWPIPTCFPQNISEYALLWLFVLGVDWILHIKTWSYLVACSPPKFRIWFMYDGGLVVKYWILYFNIFRYYSPYAILIISPMIVCYPASNSYLDPENSQSLK